MKRILGYLGAAAILSFALASAGDAKQPATPVSRDDSQVLVESEKDWAKAAFDGDADRMASYMTDDYLELTWEPAAKGAAAHWKTVRKADWVESVRRREDVYTSVEVHNLTVHVQGTLAAVTGEYSQKGTSKGKDISGAGIYVNTWIKRGGRWLLVHSVFP